MQYTLLVFVSFIAYGAGVYLLLRVTPMLLRRRYDEGLFMAIAAADIFGALLAFGGVIIPLALFSGALPARILGVILLLGLLGFGIRLTSRSFRPLVMSGTFRSSRIIAGTYSIFLVVATLYYIVQIFVVGH